MAHRRQRQHQLVRGESGFDAGGVERSPALLAGILQSCELLGIPCPRVDETRNRGRDHIDSGAQHAAQVIDAAVGPTFAARRVTDAVRLLCEERVGVLTRLHSERRPAAEFTRVSARLLGVVHPDPDQIQIGALREGAHRNGAHPACRPLHDSHPFSFFRRPSYLKPAEPEAAEPRFSGRPRDFIEPQLSYPSTRHEKSLLPFPGNRRVGSAWVGSGLRV